MVVFLMLAILTAGLNVMAVAGVIVAASHFLKQIRTLDINDPDAWRYLSPITKWAGSFLSPFVHLAFGTF